ncbi:hypothetical protein C2G38_2291528 [Gigaspora rosea]|uniref:Uncharacterized protein n=1 Tax=Gigaspora rosea TaxID=44941 RepID=A0A397VMS7_9GLOM|nr:hypothetical protein C2G38_2291528 [Gigaspora rosea]
MLWKIMNNISRSFRLLLSIKKNPSNEFDTQSIPINIPHLMFNATVTQELKTSGKTVHFGVETREYNSYTGNRDIHMPVTVFYPIQRNRFNHLRSNLKIGKLLMISGFLHIVKSTIMIEATDVDYLRQDTIYNTTKTPHQPSLPAFTDLDKIAEEINTPNPSIQKKQNIVNLDDINTNTIPTTNEDNESTSDEKR